MRTRITLAHRPTQDYLWAYFGHHHGGGFHDIKIPFGSWSPMFDKLSSQRLPSVWVFGTAEQGRGSPACRESAAADDPACIALRISCAAPQSCSGVGPSPDSRPSHVHLRRGETNTSFQSVFTEFPNAWVDGKLDESLGVEPADLTAGLDGLVGDVNGHLGTIVTAAETVSSLESHAARIGAQPSQLDTALTALQVIEEGGAALAAFVASAQTYREARAELQEVCAEAEALFQQQLPQVVGALQSLPALVAAAQQDAARASNTIAALEGHYGDGLYAPPVL